MQTQQQSSTSIGGSPPSVFANYLPSEGFDELLLSPGNLRPHWGQFVGELNRLGGEEIARRWKQAERLIHENGIAYGAYGDPLGTPRPWDLDALPLVVHQDEWELVAAGLQQRARVFEMTLADLYGPRHLIRENILPPEIIFAHPGFQTTLHGLKPSGGRYLHSYAADLGRGPDGRWWLLGDRSESPSGAGYALENRVVTSRMFPEAFRACHVQRLAGYFKAIRELCHRIAPRNKDNPRIVLLSQGQASENYFEDAYLSRYLGYTLVEGADLAVRDRSVWLKTLGGLYPVDVIIRRPNTADCDSLEIATDSLSAIPGLVDVVRAGNVAITNPLGSGLMESPIFMAFIEPLCARWLGESPLLPSVATWWCGDPKACAYVLRNLEQLDVKRAFRRRGEERFVTAELRDLSPKLLAERIQANPSEFVAQERVVRSTVPIWNGESVSTTHLALRAFLFAGDDAFEVLPGGLARTSKEVGSLELSLAAGEGSKDTWIQGLRPPEDITLLPHGSEHVALRRSGDDLPSRVADDIYWLGRHVERADSAARLLRAVTDRLSSEEGGSMRPELPMLLRTMADQGQIEPGFVVEGIREQLPAIEKMLPKAVFDTSSPGSLGSMLSAMHSTGSRVRDRLSRDSWRILVRIDELFRLPQGQLCDMSDLMNMSSELIVDLAAFNGMISESMTKTQAYHFMDLGVRTERAWQTSKLLANCFAGAAPIAGEVLESVLRVCDSLMTYRYRYLTNLSVIPVLDLLVTDDTNPRSILYQLLRIKDHVERLRLTDASANVSPEQRLLLTALYSIRMFDVEAIGEKRSVGECRELMELFRKLDTCLPQFSQAVTNKYMVHAGPARLLSAVSQPRVGES